MADNYLEKKMEEFRNRPMNSSASNSKKTGITLSKLLFKKRSHSELNSKVIVREEHLKSIAEVCGKIEFIGGITPDQFSFEFITTEQDKNGQIIIRLNLIETNVVSETDFSGYIHHASINLGFLLQTMLLRATEMGLDATCSQIIENDISNGKTIEVSIIVKP